MGQVTTKPNDAAFPDVNNAGLTIREHFASLAMQGILANPAYADHSYLAITTSSVELANELIAALNKTPAE